MARRPGAVVTPTEAAAGRVASSFVAHAAVLVLHQRRDPSMTLSSSGSPEEPRPDHFGHTGDPRSCRPGAAQVHHFRRRSLSPSTPCSNHARHDHLVFRRFLCLSPRKDGVQNLQQAPTTTLVSLVGSTSTKGLDQAIQDIVMTTICRAQECLAFSSSGDPRRAWQRRADPVLHLRLARSRKIVAKSFQEFA